MSNPPRARLRDGLSVRQSVTSGSLGTASLPGDAGGGDALDDLALEEQEHHDQRQRGEHRLGHVLRVLDGRCQGVEATWGSPASSRANASVGVR